MPYQTGSGDAGGGRTGVMTVRSVPCLQSIDYSQLGPDWCGLRESCWRAVGELLGMTGGSVVGACEGVAE